VANFETYVAEQLDRLILQASNVVFKFKEGATRPNHQLSEACQARQQLYALKREVFGAFDLQMSQACRKEREQQWQQ
jgi:hypothetical protein